MPPHFVEDDFWELEVLRRRQVRVDRVQPVPKLLFGHLVWQFPNGDILPVNAWALASLGLSLSLSLTLSLVHRAATSGLTQHRHDSDSGLLFVSCRPSFNVDGGFVPGSSLQPELGIKV